MIRDILVAKAARTFVLLFLIVLFLSLPVMTRVHAAPGDLDTTFGNGGKVVTDFGLGDNAEAVLVQNDGKIVAVGVSGTDFALVRYNTNGSLDSTFGNGGKLTTDFFGGTDLAFAAVLQKNGKIVAVGTASRGSEYFFALARYNTDGSLDSSFGAGGLVTTDLFSQFEGEQAYAAVIQNDGRIIAAGIALSNGAGGIALARYNSDGSLDTTFGVGGSVSSSLFGTAPRVEALALQPDNKIVIAGYIISNFGQIIDFALARYESNGSVDVSFGTDGRVTTDFSSNRDIAHAVAVHSDGKIVAAGITNSTNPSTTHSALARYNTDGSLDQTFGVDGRVIGAFHNSFDETKAILIQKDGKVVTGGQTIAGLLVARYNVDGSLDQTFGSGGFNVASVGDLSTDARSIGIQRNGNIVAAGIASNLSTSLDFAVVRFLDSTLRITGATVSGKKLIVSGEGFESGAKILLNGASQKSRNDDENPTTKLIGKKAGKKIRSGDKLQVQNPDGSLSPEFTYN